MQAQSEPVWLIARCTAERKRAFRGHRRCNTGKDSCGPSRFLVMPTRQQLQDAQETRSAQHRVVGIALVSPSFAYSPLCVLSDKQQEYRDVWRQIAPDVQFDDGSLLFYHVQAAVALQHPVGIEALFGSRKVLKTWMLCSDSDGCELFNSLTSIPRWCDRPPSIAVALPYHFADECVAGTSTCFAVLKNWPSAQRYNEKHSIQGFGEVPYMPVPASRVLDTCHHDMAEDLRSIGLSMIERGFRPDDEELQVLNHWVGVLQNTADQRFAGVGPKGKHAMKVQQVLLSDALRSDADMKPVLKACAKMLLPPGRAAELIAQLEVAKPPDKADLSRNRFLVDCAHCLLWRRWHSEAMAGAECAWYIMTDASPQFHREYQVTLLRRIRKDDLVSMIAASDELCSLWDVSKAGYQTFVKENELFQELIRGG